MSKPLQTASAQRGFRQHVAAISKKIWRTCLRKEADASLRDAIEELIEEDNEGEPSIDNDEKLILGNVLNLRDLTTEDVMVPYANIIAMPSNASKDEIVAAFIKSDVSQIPVYTDTVDNIIGLLSIKDALAWAAGKATSSLKALLKDILFVAPTMRTLDLLLQMRETGVRMAVVVDEYGGVDGIVTFANLIEEIIGDIQYAEDQRVENPVEFQQNGVIVLKASTPLEELNDALKKVYEEPVDWLEGLDNDDIDTIGGVVTSIAERVPVRGELIVHPRGVEFEILDADPRHIKKIAIRNLASPRAAPASAAGNH